MIETLLQAALRAREAGHLAEAARLCSEFLHSHPRHFYALYVMGLLDCENSRFEHAERMFAEALALDPRSAGALYMRGCALKELNRISEALVCFDQAAAIQPEFIEAHINRAAALVTLKRNEQALQAIGKALALDPDNAGAWNNRGCILRELNRPNDAVGAFEKAVALKPDFTAALTNYGSVVAESKRYEEAAAIYERALAVTPELPFGRGTLALYRLNACDWRHLEDDTAEIAAGVNAGKRVIYPFDNLLLSSSTADQLACARIWVENDARAAETPLWRGERYNHSKIRLAYVSADFHAHATAVLLAGVLEHHDRSRFEIIGVSLGRNDNSPLRARVSAAFDRFLDVASKSAAEIAASLRDMEIDIAVDLKAYTQHHRPGLFGLRPVPIQVNYLGYPGTMGAPYIDYILADPTVIPEADRKYYAEAVAYLPDSYQCNDAKRTIAMRTPTRKEADLPESGFVFCCFNSAYKIRPELFAIWMRLLKGVPGSVLWLLDDNPASTRNLKSAAADMSVAPERLVFASRVSLEEHLARHRLAGLFLDTLPCGAHTTASDALWAGLPLLTCRGSTFAGRVAASLLKAIGMPELIVDTLDAYEAMAFKLAKEPQTLRDLQEKLMRNRKTAPLFDTAAITRHLEAAYETMWRCWQAGLPPQSFTVDRA